MADIFNKENLSPTRRSTSPFRCSSPLKGSSPTKISRRARSKSIGPDGILEQQKSTASPEKNRRKSSFAPAPKSILPSKADEAKRREARRKSLANRRVSFAPEATLHTWDVIEYMREATTSSTSSEESRRASRSTTDDQGSDPVDVPSIPDAAPSPAQRKRRRSSAIPPLNFNDPDEDYSSSPAGDSSPLQYSEDGSENGDEEDDEEDEDSDAMSLVSVDNTANLTVQSTTSAGTSDSSLRLHQLLDEATDRVGTPNIREIISGYPSDEDDTGDVDEAEEDEEPHPITQQQGALTPMAKNLIAFQDQENVNPFSPAFRAHAGRPSTIAEEDTADISMEMTRAIGGILGSKSTDASVDDATMDFTQVGGRIYEPSPLKSALKRRRSTADTGSPMVHEEQSRDNDADRTAKRRRSILDPTPAGDGTMDFTAAFGAIQPSVAKDETMEFTTAIGQIIRSQSPIKVSRRQSVRRRRSSVQSVISNDQTMDFTMAVGAIKQQQASPVKAVPQIPEEDETVTGHDDPNEDMSMDLTTALGNVMDQRQDPSPRPTTPHHLSPPRQEEPPTTPKDQGRFKEAHDLSAKKMLTPIFMKEAGVSPLPSSVQIRKSPGSAQKSTPLGKDFPAIKPVTPMGSPKRMSQSPTRTPLNLPAPANSAKRTPSVSPQRSLYPKLPQERSVLTPVLSPKRNAEIAAPKTEMPTTPQPKSSPAKILSSPFKAVAEAKLERDLDVAQPSPQRSQTKMLDTIRSMSTPKKDNKLNATPLKRLKEMTPMKTPLSKARTTRITTPKVQFSAPSPDATAQLNKELLRSLSESQPTQKITITNFLSAAGIKFMDLTASKRRYTAAPTPSKRAAFTSAADEPDPETGEIDAMAAGVCTVPELDLYVHACRELKRYMSEGRSVLKQLEKSVEADAPPFMAAYLTGHGEQKRQLDAALSEMKAKARMESKEIWYAWRRELLCGLEGGLREIERGLARDESELEKRESALRVLEEARVLRDELEREVADLEATVQHELDSSEELQVARQELLEVTAAADEQKALLARAQAELDGLERQADLYVDGKVEALAAIAEAERVKEASRGITAAEVAAYNTSLLALEAATGWRIATASSSTAALTMTYKGEVQLFFSPAAFLSGNRSRAPSDDNNAPISLTYIAADADARRPAPLTTEKRFLLQLLRAQLQMLDQSGTSVAALLAFVGQGWEAARSLSETIRRLRLAQPVEVQILSDEKLAVEVSVLLAQVETKVALSIEVEACVVEGGGEGKGSMRLELSRECRGRVVYGEQYKEGKMGEFLAQRVGQGLERAEEAVEELRLRLEKTGRKG